MKLFFDGRWAGQPVYLDLEDEVLAEMGALACEGGDPAELFQDAVRRTLNTRPDGASTMLAEHCARTRRWQRDGRLGTPPFLAVLAFFSLVAEGMRTDEEFRASNYYGRLSTALAVRSGDQPARQKVQRGIMDESHTLWGALNDWLIANEERLGIPTAYAFDYRVHVGIPISQALVREGDRKALREMFADLRLRPGQSLSRSDMARMLESWLPTAPVSKSLARLAGHPEALQRVGDVACIELQAWDGLVEGRERSGVREASAAQLAIAAAVRQQPRPRIELFLLGRGLPLRDEAAGFFLAADPSSHARAAVQDTDGILSVEPPDSAGWSRVRNGDAISMADVLLAKLELEHGDITLKRDPRRLVVLEYDEEWRRYAEVSRVQLGQDNLLLCHESLRAQLEEVLPTITRSGYSVYEPQSLAGLPEGWVAYEGVEVMGLLETAVADLSPLAPLAWSQIALGGGFPLPERSAWLTEGPPEIRASSFASGDLEVAIIPSPSTDAEQISLGCFSGSRVFALEDSGLPDGDYRVTLIESKAEGAVLASQALHLRSPETPRPTPRQAGVAPLAHALGTGWGAFSASALADPTTPSAKGAWVHGDVPAATRLDGPVPPATLELRSLANDAELTPASSMPPKARGGEAPVCLLGGAHHWLLEDATKTARWRVGDIGGVCKHCGLERFFPSRPWSRRRGAGHRAGRGRAMSAPMSTALTDVTPIKREEASSFNRLVAALCYTRFGGWTAFSRLAQQTCDDPWFAVEAARLLSAVGHIDFELDATSLRPTRWEVAPATLAVLPEAQEAILCGHRSRGLIKAVNRAVSRLEGKFLIEEQTGAPDLLRIAALPGDGFEDVTALATAEGYPLHVAATADKLAASLPRLAAAVSALPTLDRALDAPLQRFDFGKNKWVPAEELSQPGAYRFARRPFVYACVKEEYGRPIICDNRLVKWLGASAIGLELLAYNPSDQTLRCPLGAQLPYLYERAVVMCSGRAPLQLTDGTVGYASVPTGVAAGVWAALYASPPALMRT